MYVKVIQVLCNVLLSKIHAYTNIVTDISWYTHSIVTERPLGYSLHSNIKLHNTDKKNTLCFKNK